MRSEKITILGAGESGTGAAILAKSKGFDVFVSDYSSIRANYKKMLDARGIPWEEGKHSEDIILSSSLIIKSPGIADSTSIMQKVRKQGIPAISEIEFACRYSQSFMICITGSNGKTTTTSLIYHILKNAGLDVGLAGNIGSSLALQVAESPHSYYVIELSSFQLDNMYDFRANIAVLLNITPDHLDRYDHRMQNYVDSKFRIIRNQTADDMFIFWNDDPIIAGELHKYTFTANLYPFALDKKSNVKGYVNNNQIVIETNNENFNMDTQLLSLTGEHNIYNSLAAAIAAKAVNISDEKIRAALSDFTGVEHRLEKVARVRGVDYINDSKATNVNSCWYALKSIPTKIILILGGTDKGNNYSEIEAIVKEKVHALIFLGVDNSKLHNFFDRKVAIIEDAGSMQEAVDKAYNVAEKGQTVLLSPCCASFDLFKNYEDRGNQFKACVLNL
ncbi:MAG: UDP-N-acetylmuramoyl-L-alanine--D-glutamate ligase [Tannerellaceae bacterium]|jgi:UDP-N-acetylmuramoylalanine--D-glutamate ligase|nr:UDP-N-acetylmuramoyl-L-alanine--D-glutamate ligase [Tannerellaceae bacterium]